LKFSPAESEVRPKGGSEIKKSAEIMPTFCYAVGMCNVWIRRRALQSAAENIDYRDLLKT
jgi:hypothetical protein